MTKAGAAPALPVDLPSASSKDEWPTDLAQVFSLFLDELGWIRRYWVHRLPGWRRFAAAGGTGRASAFATHGMGSGLGALFYGFSMVAMQGRRPADERTADRESA